MPDSFNSDVSFSIAFRLMVTVPIVALALPLTCDVEAAVQWPASAGGNNHYYEGIHVVGGATWEEARSSAQNLGGYLATIHSQAENDFVYNLITDYSYWHIDGAPVDSFTGPWLGGTQLPGSTEPAGGWTWVTSEPWNYINWHLDWGGVDLPDNADNADKLHFIHQWSSTTQPTQFWDDLNGNTRLAAYVVEWVPEPSTVALLILAVGMTAICRSRIVRND